MVLKFFYDCFIIVPEIEMYLILIINKFPSLSRVDVFLYFVDVISVQIDWYKILDFNNNNRIRRDKETLETLQPKNLLEGLGFV